MTPPLYGRVFLVPHEKVNGQRDPDSHERAARPPPAPNTAPASNFSICSMRRAIIPPTMPRATHTLMMIRFFVPGDLGDSGLTAISQEWQNKSQGLIFGGGAIVFKLVWETLQSALR